MIQAQMQLSRRSFLKSTAETAAGLVIALHLSGPKAFAQQSANEADDAFTPNVWLRITPDDQVTILVEKPELGQGARTYTPMMVAEELEFDWSNIHVEQAPTIPAIYHNLRTGGSGGVEKTYTLMRQAGAHARELLITAAAQQWHVSRSECQVEKGTVLHTTTGRRLRYGELVGAASMLPALKPDDIVLKEPKDFKVIGKPMPRTDVPSKVDGTAVFGLDVRIPGLLFAVIARCPYFGGKLRSYAEATAKAVPGVRAVFAVPPLPRHFNTAGGIAVVANSTWAAIQGSEKLEATWEKGPGANESTETLKTNVNDRVKGPPTFVAIDRGKALEILSRAAKRIEADYESPFQAHATLEVMNTTVHVRNTEIEVWAPTQFADEVQKEIANLSGFPLGKVIVHTTLSGGSFGRRYQWDYAAEAWQVAKEVQAPVQLMRTREHDMQHDFYRPYNRQHLAATFDEAGKVLAWSTRVVTTPIAASNLYTSYVESPETLKDPATIAALEWYGADVVPYAIQNVRVDYAPADSVVPRSWWRSVASSYTPFAKECFIDELAHAQRRDPLQFRMDLLTDESPEAKRVKAVLRLAAEKANWGRPLSKRHGRGIAWRTGGSCSALVAEVLVGDDGNVHVLRCVSAVDCGIAVNPDGVRAMIEGGTNFALTAVLNAQITIRDGAVEQSNFHDYQVLRIDSAPDIEVYLLPSTEDPMGVGELGAMLIAPAVANAIFDATGVRIRRLPVDPALLKKA
jgi:isoquinoline 1-oxidoreductase beta subunit